MNYWPAEVANLSGMYRAIIQDDKRTDSIREVRWLESTMGARGWVFIRILTSGE